MNVWNNIEGAPTHKHIIGRNKDGEEKEIFWHSINEYVSGWVSNIDDSDQNWKRHKMFYPVEWKEVME